MIAGQLDAGQCDLNQLLIRAAQSERVSPAARSLRQRRAQSPPPGFMNHSVHDLSYLCACVATHLAAVPMDRPRPFLQLAWQPRWKVSRGRRRSDIMETDDGWGDWLKVGWLLKWNPKITSASSSVLPFSNKTQKMRLKIYGLSFTILHFLSFYEMQSICCSWQNNASCACFNFYISFCQFIAGPQYWSETEPFALTLIPTAN